MSYCTPKNVTASGYAEISRRLADLIRCLHVINAAVASGDIISDLQLFAEQMQTKLEAEGWSFSYDGGPKLKARPPGHKYPFPKRMTAKGTQTEP